MDVIARLSQKWSDRSFKLGGMLLLFFFFYFGRGLLGGFLAQAGFDGGRKRLGI